MDLGLGFVLGNLLVVQDPPQILFHVQSWLLNVYRLKAIESFIWHGCLGQKRVHFLGLFSDSHPSSWPCFFQINVLLQAFISQLKLEGFALMADMVYVTQVRADLCHRETGSEQFICSVCLGAGGWGTHQGEGMLSFALVGSF